MSYQIGEIHGFYVWKLVTLVICQHQLINCPAFMDVFVAIEEWLFLKFFGLENVLWESGLRVPTQPLFHRPLQEQDCVHCL